jgi:phosphoribosylformylglycinamidine cyclo-ligase
VRVGDRVWGLPSTGLHTNGYSLARRVVAGLDLSMRIDAGTVLADALLAPHPSYYQAVTPVLPRIKALAHITGGGVPGNLPRVLPTEVGVELDWGAWPVPPIFDFLMHAGRIPFDEMWRVFNMGLGMLLVLAPEDDPRADCPGAVEVGRVVPRGSDAVLLLR